MLTNTSDLPSPDRKRLQEMGLTLQHSSTEEYYTASDMELSCRQILLNILDKELGPSERDTPLEFAKAQLIRDAIGDNRNASLFTQVFSRWKSESAEKLIKSGQATNIMKKLIIKNKHLLDLPQI